jgi:predicted glycoside hydrolase/deacetylase ChbG (UPF0249 family)
LVNADDFAYFPGVSRGIIDAHRKGIVTATGLLANGFSFADDIKMLESNCDLDVGVHLNLTFGRPLTSNMRAHFYDNGEEFMSKIAFARKYLGGAISTENVRDEWSAQIEKSFGTKLRIWFLNSHEHVHLFPSLFKLAHELGDKYSIPYVRRPAARMFETFKPGHFVRSGIVKTLAAINRSSKKEPELEFLGFGQSGRLTLSYLTKLLRDLRPGRIYELMCHPGYEQGVDSGFAHLRQYHDWDLEVQTLTSPVIREVCEEEQIELIGYRDIDRIVRESAFDNTGRRQ